MSTPYLDEAERCSRVALVHEGTVLALDEPARLRTLIGGRMLEVIAPGRRAAEILRQLPGVSDAQVFGERVHVTLADGTDRAEEQFRTALSSTALATAPVRRVPPSLEDVFIARLSGTRESLHA
jgi:ABC-2 type transport system ATP-binding protein